MNIWLVSIFEQTPVDNVFSTRFLSIAEQALSRGHKVTFWGSTFKHNTKNQRFEKTTRVSQGENYELVFVKSLAYQKNISPKRLYSHAVLGKDMVKAFEGEPKPDVILMAFPPISLAFRVTKYASSHGIPVVLDIIDPWPDLFEREVPGWAQPLAKAVFWEPKRRVKQAFSRTTLLTSISNQYLTWSEKYFSVARKECLYPAADYSAVRNFIENAEPLGQDKAKLNVIYAGSLASSYDIPTILKAAEELKDESVHFFIAGAGPQESLIQSYPFKNVTFLGRLAKDELMRYYAHCDLGLTQHISGATQSVTYKLFDLLAAGLPILNSLESEMREIILSHEVGMHNDPGDHLALAQNIQTFLNQPEMLKSYKENGLKLAREVGNTQLIYNRFIDLLEDVAS